MKKEVFRISDLSVSLSDLWALSNISLSIFENEVVALLGLGFSGKDTLVRLLTGDMQQKDLPVYLDGVHPVSARQLKDLIYRIEPGNYRIADWTVAEFISLQKSGWILRRTGKNALQQQTEEKLAHFGIDIDAGKSIRDLKEYEKRLMDLAKAIISGYRIIIIEDEFEDIPDLQLQEFARQLKKISANEHLAVIINSNSIYAASVLADSYVFFRDGKIVKKCHKKDIRNTDELESYLLGSRMQARQGLEAIAEERMENGESEEEIVFRVRSIPIRGRLQDFTFRQGSVTTFLCEGEKERRRLFNTLSGREMPAGAYCLIDGVRLTGGDFAAFIRKRIVSVYDPAGEEQILRYMTLQENLLLPSLAKLRAGEYLLASDTLIGAVDAQTELTMEGHEKIAGADDNTIIRIVMERWLLFHPKVIIFLEPFIHCDLYGVSIIRSCIRRFARAGTAVIIVKCREEHVVDISDRVISLY